MKKGDKEMNEEIKVLFAGEAIYISQTIFKGWNDFHLGSYCEHGGYFIRALENAGIDVTYLPTFRVQEEFPWTIEELRKYDAIAVSDVDRGGFYFRPMIGFNVTDKMQLNANYVGISDYYYWSTLNLGITFNISKN